MPRARNIKYALFTNDDLADNDPIGRLLFIGMWTIADYNGNFLWKPRRVKMELLPYDNCDIEELAINLERSGFIRFYSDGGSTYVNVVNFAKHQNPHKNERDKPSIFPKYADANRVSIGGLSLAINPDSSGVLPEDSASDRADSLSLIPDSLSPIPDCGLPDLKDLSAKADVTVIFDYWLSAMNKTKSAKLTAKRKSVITARLKDGYTIEQIRQAIDGCARSDYHMGKNDTGTKYDDIELICRTGEKLEHFGNNIGVATPVHSGQQTSAEKIQAQGERLTAMMNQATEKPVDAVVEAEYRDINPQLGYDL